MYMNPVWVWELFFIIIIPQVSCDVVRDAEPEVIASGSDFPGGRISAQGAQWSCPPPLFAPCNTAWFGQKHLKPSPGLFGTKQSFLQADPQTFTLGLPAMALEKRQSPTEPVPSMIPVPDKEQVIPEPPAAAVEEEEAPVRLREKFLAVRLMPKTVEDEERPTPEVCYAECLPSVVDSSTGRSSQENSQRVNPDR